MRKAKNPHKRKIKVSRLPPPIESLNFPISIVPLPEEGPFFASAETHTP